MCYKKNKRISKPKKPSSWEGAFLFYTNSSLFTIESKALFAHIFHIKISRDGLTSSFICSSFVNVYLEPRGAWNLKDVIWITKLVIRYEPKPWKLSLIGMIRYFSMLGVVSWELLNFRLLLYTVQYPYGRSASKISSLGFDRSTLHNDTSLYVIVTFSHITLSISALFCVFFLISLYSDVCSWFHHRGVWYKYFVC